MKIKILDEPRRTLLELLSRVRREVDMVAPFYDMNMIGNIIREIPENVTFRLLTRVDSNSDPEALEKIAQYAEIRAIRNLHAKLYIFDDSKAIISSANLDASGNIEIGVLLSGKSRPLNELINLFQDWWKQGEKITSRKIKESKELIKNRQKESVASEPAISFGKRITPKERIEEIRVIDKHLILNINWNPYGYKKPWTGHDADRKIYCHDRPCVCESSNGKDHCASAVLFKTYLYATTKNAILKDRLVFFIARNPYLGGRYYFVGFLCMKSNKHLGKAWGKNLFWFEADKNRSVLFPTRGEAVIEVHKDLIEKMGSLRGNPKYISSEDALNILTKYYKKTMDEKVRNILKRSFLVRI